MVVGSNAPVLDKDSSLEGQLLKKPVVTINSKKVAWLFGIDDTSLDRWVSSGILTPCNPSAGGTKRFWREDIATILEDHGA